MLDILCYSPKKIKYDEIAKSVSLHGQHLGCLARHSHSINFLNKLGIRLLSQLHEDSVDESSHS